SRKWMLPASAVLIRANSGRLCIICASFGELFPRGHFGLFSCEVSLFAQSATHAFPYDAAPMEIDRTNRRGRFSAAGMLLPAEAGKLAISALAAAGAESLKTLVVDFSGVHIERPLSVTECYQLGERLAQAGSGLQR